jgi:Arc/MetJ-type ribon-helix-helix transcriptional regulator
MVRQQISITTDQLAQIKQWAKAHDSSQSEFIRQAIDLYLARTAAWQRAVALMRSLQAQGPLPTARERWNRDGLYEEREGRQRRGQA